jgi:hypothetical protein
MDTASASFTDVPKELHKFVLRGPLVSMPAGSGPLTAIELGLWLCCAATVLDRHVDARDVVLRRFATDPHGTKAAAAKTLQQTGHSGPPPWSFVGQYFAGVAGDMLLFERVTKAAVNGLGYVGLTAARLRTWLAAARDAGRDRAIWPPLAEHPCVTEATWNYLRYSAGIYDLARIECSEVTGTAQAAAEEAVTCLWESFCDTVEFLGDLRFTSLRSEAQGGGECITRHRHIHYVPDAVLVCRTEVSSTTAPLAARRLPKRTTATHPVQTPVLAAAFRFLRKLSVRYCGLRCIDALVVPSEGPPPSSLALTSVGPSLMVSHHVTPCLEVLDVSMNALTTLPLAVLTEHPTLTYLDVSGNRVNAFHATFGGTKGGSGSPHASKLVHLDLANNHLAGTFPPASWRNGVESAWVSLPRLKELDVSGNVDLDCVDLSFLQHLVDDGVELSFLGMSGFAVNETKVLASALAGVGVNPRSAADVDLVLLTVARCERGVGDPAGRTNQRHRADLRSALGSCVPPFERDHEPVLEGRGALSLAQRLKRVLIVVFASVALWRRTARLVAADDIVRRQADAANVEGKGQRVGAATSVHPCGAVPFPDSTQPRHVWRRLARMPSSGPSSHRRVKGALLDSPGTTL